MDGGLGGDNLYAGAGLDTASYASITESGVTIVLSHPPGSGAS